MKRKLSLMVAVIISVATTAAAQVMIKDSLNYVQHENITAVPVALNFIVMGDWGRVGADHQKEVAVQMGKTASEIKAQFIVSTGDNFYPSGVVSEWDPLWRYSFEDIYTNFSLQWDWYPVLGNHDYKTSPDAQVRYSKISSRWKMPARYYSKEIQIPGDTVNKILILFIDTNPLIPEFYSNAEYGPNVKAADSTQQKKWIAKTLSTADKSIKWKIVVGHHPLYTGGGRTDAYDTKAVRRILKPMFDKYGADIYLSGHEHSLQHLVSGKTQYFISGAASEKTPAHLVPESEMAASEYGFMIFSVTSSKILVQTITDKGEVIYTTAIKKSNGL
jgi:tartrate-resistant acid phosphatase type 5